MSPEINRIEMPSLPSFISLFGLVCIFGSFMPIGSRSQGGSYGGCETSRDSRYAHAKIFARIKRNYVSYSCVTCQIGAREVHVLSVYTSANRGIWWTGDSHTGYVEVIVSPSGSTTPVLLVLTSYDNVIWKIMQLTSQIKEILVIQGSKSQVRFMGNDTAVPVSRVQGSVGYGRTTEELEQLMSKLRSYTSFITSLTGIYEADSFTLTPSGHECKDVTHIREWYRRTGELNTTKPRHIEHSHLGCDIYEDSSEAFAEASGYIPAGYKLYSCVTCQLNSLTIPEAREVNVLSVYTSDDWWAGDNSYRSIKVTVLPANPSRKMFLVLTSYDAITWKLEEISEQVQQILLISYGAKASVELPESRRDVPVTDVEGWVGYGSTREELAKLMSKLKYYTSYITSLTGVYEAESFTLKSSRSACSGKWHVARTEILAEEKPEEEKPEEESPEEESPEGEEPTPGNKWNASLSLAVILSVLFVCFMLIGLYCVCRYTKKRRNNNEVNRQRAAPSTTVREPSAPPAEHNASNSYTPEAEQPTAPLSEYIELQHPTVPLNEDQELRRPLAPQNDDLPPSYEDYDKYPIPQHRQGPSHAPQATPGAGIAPDDRQPLTPPPEYQSLNHGVHS